MRERTVYVVRSGDHLVCGSPTCGARVGRLGWDAYGWLRPMLTSPVCPACGRRQALSPERLEAATQALYLSAASELTA